MTSIDGLITGMNTTDTINQLMQVEAAPQTALKTKISTANKVVSAYQSVNTRLSSLASAASALGSSATWGAMKATSNSTAAVVSAAAGAGAGSLSFRVEKLATTETLTFTDQSVSSASDPAIATVMAANSFTIAVSPTDIRTITPDNKSLQSVVTAINKESGLPYKAAAVQIGPGQYTMQLTAKTSGAAAAIDPTTLPSGLDLINPATTVIGADAELTVGTDATYTITSASNTFANVMSGVTVTVTKAQALTDPPVTIDVTADAEGIATKVQAMIDNANVVLSEIASQSKIKTGAVAAGPLVGDSAMRKLSQDILSTVSAGATGLGSNGTTASFKDVWVSTDSSGQLAFDKTKFLEAYKADPVKTQKYFDTYEEKAGGTAATFDPGFDTAVGLGRRLQSVALVASVGVPNPLDPAKPKQGIMQALIKRNTDTIKGLNDQVGEWDNRLEMRRDALQKQFSNLEVALGKMQQQSSWLAGQLAGLG